MHQPSFRGAFIFLALLVAVSAASCANSTEAPGDGGTEDVKAIGPCGPGSAVMCGSTCVDTQSDFQNCGTCGNKCPGDQVCSHGVCAVVCGGGTARCGNDCVDAKSDVNNCGGCGTKCPTGNVCSNGTCSVTCQDGLTDCNGDCVDTTQNDDNCGACGSPCGGGQVCSNGKCIATCAAGWSSCGVGDAGATTCVDTRYDTNNCGACNAACPGGELCSPVNNVGTCSLQCNGGTTKCGTACVDESIDPNHCGACATTCSGGTPSCTSGHCCANGQLYCGGCDSVANCILKNGGVLAAGGSHTCAITLGGQLKCWGGDFYGQIGDGQDINNAATPYTVTSVQNPVYIGAGYDFTCAATASGTAYCWGDGEFGELGNNDENEFDSPQQVLGISNAVRIDGGEDQGCALLGSGSIMCWGANFEGEVGDGTGVEQDSPVATGITAGADISAGLGYHTCAVNTAGNVKCWGEGDYGECGNNQTSFTNLSPVLVKTGPSTNLANAKSVGIGNVHSCAVLNDGTLWCWGDDEFSELGDGKTTQSNVAIQVPGITTALAVAAGGDGFSDAHTCVLLTGGIVECWGSNEYGQLGDGTIKDRTSPVTPIASGAIAIAAGEYHTCAYKNDGSVWCWGYNADNEIGDGTTTNRKVPTQVTGF